MRITTLQEAPPGESQKSSKSSRRGEKAVAESAALRLVGNGEEIEERKRIRGTTTIVCWIGGGESGEATGNGGHLRVVEYEERRNSERSR